MIDDALHAKLNNNSFLVAIVNGMAGETPFHVIIYGVTIQECGFHFAANDSRSVFGSGHILLGNLRGGDEKEED